MAVRPVTQTPTTLKCWRRMAETLDSVCAMFPVQLTSLSPPPTKMGRPRESRNAQMPTMGIRGQRVAMGRREN